MKVLFLDCDGIINCSTTDFSANLWPIDPVLASRIKKIVAETGCKVVLSSSWRNSSAGISAVKRNVCPIYDATWRDPRSIIRGDEIQKWLDEFEVEKYAILDDDDDMLPNQLPNFFRTTWEEGLTEEITQKVIIHLK